MTQQGISSTSNIDDVIELLVLLETVAANCESNHSQSMDDIPWAGFGLTLNSAREKLTTASMPAHPERKSLADRIKPLSGKSRGANLEN